MARQAQDKQAEVDFFDGVADQGGEYDVFHPEATEKLIDRFQELTGLQPGAKVADLGCGSGAFTNVLAARGYRADGVDLSPKLIAIARAKFPTLSFHVGDVESLEFPDASVDGVLLSGLVHHLPDPMRCAKEVHRILKAGGVFMAFDPNRLSPFMYLYRDRSSPLYSPKGVTPNERPVLAREVRAHFESAGLTARSAYVHGLSYRYVESARARFFLPVYNAIDKLLFWPSLASPLRPFVITYGSKSPGTVRPRKGSKEIDR